MSNISKYIKDNEDINDISLEASYDTNNNCTELTFYSHGSIQIKQMLVLMVAPIRDIPKPSISQDTLNILSSANDVFISEQTNNPLHIISLADDTLNIILYLKLVHWCRYEIKGLFVFLTYNRYKINNTMLSQLIIYI